MPPKAVDLSRPCYRCGGHRRMDGFGDVVECTQCGAVEHLRSPGSSFPRAVGRWQNAPAHAVAMGLPEREFVHEVECGCRECQNTCPMGARAE